ncbi:MAG: protein kinase [Pyrinomonadaceae bacterium]
MKPERWQEISRIFEAAKSLAPGVRDVFVKGQCAGDRSLQQEVERLLESHRNASSNSFLGGGAADRAAPLILSGNSEDEHGERSSLQGGQEFGPYVVIDKIGVGGMGEVYLANDARLDRTVALKILPSNVSTDKRRMQRFRQEARVASSLNQPNILTIFEFGEINGQTFIATEFVDGETLRNYLRGKRLKLTEILDIAIQILAALDAAHETRIVHRDIKPENIMIRRRDHVVKVLDFGLAKLTETKPSSLGDRLDTEAATEFKTAPGTVLGTINYMSPEQTQGHGVDGRTDLWSTGIMLYEMVAGVQPFKGPTSSHTIVQILEKDPVPLGRVDASVPAELQRIVAKAMAKAPEERYQSAKDMLIDLRSLRRELDRELEIQRSAHSDMAVSAQPVVPADSTMSSASTSQLSQKRSNVTKFVIGIAAVLIVIPAVVFGVRYWRAKNSAPLPDMIPSIAQRKLTYSVTVQKYENNRPIDPPFQVAREMLFIRGYEIRLNINSPQSGYLYVFNEGPHENTEPAEFVVLFPSPTSNNGSAYINEGRKLQIPEKSWFRLDSEKGVEKVWLIFASGELRELEPARNFANEKTHGLITDVSVRDRVESFINSHLQNAAMQTRNDELKETNLTTSGDLLVHVIQLEHQ